MAKITRLLQLVPMLFIFSSAFVHTRLRRCNSSYRKLAGDGSQSITNTLVIPSRSPLTSLPTSSPPSMRISSPSSTSRLLSSIVSTVESTSDTSAGVTRNPVDGMISFARVLWAFTRPHTIVGSGISVLALYAFGTPPQLWGSSRFFQSLGSCLLPALLMNIYITGLNQVTDIEIDRVNKPYLPLASGELSKGHGIVVVLASLVSSLFLVRNAAWPLQAAVMGSCLLGTLYSMPPFRLKRYPALAAFCILIVRGSLVNMGFFLQAKTQMLGETLPSFAISCKKYPESVLLTSYFAVFGLVIALMKDVPDVKGDKINSISSFSVRLGAPTMFRTAWHLLVALLASSSAACISTLFIPQLKAITPIATKTIVTCRLALATILGLFAVDVSSRAGKVNVSKPDSIFSYYMHIWNIFYACYFLLPLLR